jgi:hypothetical protein
MCWTEKKEEIIFLLFAFFCLRCFDIKERKKNERNINEVLWIWFSFSFTDLYFF